MRTIEYVLSCVVPGFWDEGNTSILVDPPLQATPCEVLRRQTLIWTEGATSDQGL